MVDGKGFIERDLSMVEERKGCIVKLSFNTSPSGSFTSWDSQCSFSSPSSSEYHQNDRNWCINLPRLEFRTFRVSRRLGFSK